jgi:protease I
MEQILEGKKVAFLVEDGFERSELVEPMEALEQVGATVQIVSPHQRQVRSWDMENWGESFVVDMPLRLANPEEYDSLVLPGGVMNPDKLRMNEDAIAFVRSFIASYKPVAAICHGPWTLVSADVVDGRKMTSYPSLAADLINAGADWVDEEVVVDRGLITSRTPQDLPAFNQKLIEEIKEGIHHLQPA